jgi:DNA-binding Lrp family transcriptional regulator
MKIDQRKNKTPFISLPHSALECFLSDIKAGKNSEVNLNFTDFVVYVLFLKTFNQKLGYSWISNEYIAEKLGKEPRTIFYSVARLLKAGYIYRYEPTNEDRKLNPKLHESYCTRPLIRMTAYNDPIIDEREQYKNLISQTVSKNKKCPQLRKHKLPPKSSAANLGEKPSTEIRQQTVQKFADLEDDPPF